MKTHSQFAGVALVGAGTVGGGVLQLLHDNRAVLERRCGRAIRVVAVAVRDKEKARRRLGDFLGKAVLTESWREAVDHPESEIVLELIGGDKAAAECIRAAQMAGKPVVTANKSLLATQGAEIFARPGAPIRFEAAVAGCVPIVRTLNESLGGDCVSEVCGIINGTSNYILSSMENQRRDFSCALEHARQLGIAEADASLDIGGADAAHKLALICRLAFGVLPSPDDIDTRGIEGFDIRDIDYAARFGFRVKLLARAKKTGRGLELSVQPSLLALSHPLASVEGAMNAVFVRSDFAGETVYFGAGAGAKPTASAVVADLVDIVRGGAGRGFPAAESLPLAAAGDAVSAHYLRLQVVDKPGVLAEVTRILAMEEISIEAIVQNDSAPQQEVTVTLLLHKTARRRVAQSVARIEQLPAVVAAATAMPIVDS